MNVVVNDPSCNKNCDKITFAMFIINYGYDQIPEEFYHNPTIYDKCGRTVCSYLINNGFEVPEKWRYDPEL